MRIQKTPKVNLNEIFLSASLIERMTVLTPKNLVLGAVVAVLALYVVYHLDNTLFGLRGFMIPLVLPLELVLLLRWI